LREQRVLLILDNVEHLLPGIRDDVHFLHEQVPDLTIIATSQLSLGIPDELIFEVEPLRMAASAGDDSKLDDHPAVALFAARAAKARTRFRLDVRTLPTV